MWALAEGCQNGDTPTNGPGDIGVFTPPVLGCREFLWDPLKLGKKEKKRKIPPTGDTDSLDQCGWYHRYRKKIPTNFFLPSV